MSNLVDKYPNVTGVKGKEVGEAHATEREKKGRAKQGGESGLSPTPDCKETKL